MYLFYEQIRSQIHRIKTEFLSGRLILGVGLVWLCLGLVTGCAHERAVDRETSLFADTLQIYRGPLNHLDAVRRGVCPMHPSCSEYGRQAVRNHGFVIGWAMAMDRLLRCGRDELKLAQKIWVAGQWKFYDPVSFNDSWWRSGNGNMSEQGPLTPQ